MKHAIVLLSALMLGTRSNAQGMASPGVGTLGTGTLDGLMRARSGKIAHYASTDLKGGNADFRRIAPGQTLTLVDHRGAGIVRRWWVTVAPRNNVDLQRQLIVRCWWDGESSPSVEVPLSDFFGVGFGQWKQFVSLPLSMTSGGYNCFWPMPFSRLARITIENRSQTTCDAFYYNIDIQTLPSPLLLQRQSGDPLLYFHAQFRRTNPTVAGQDVPILEAVGRGHYVGTLLSMQNRRSRRIGFLEGDERAWIDGEAQPSIVGTGTEDYFSSGWYFDTGTYSSPYNGLTIKDAETGRISAYRWHIEDAIPFTKSLRFHIEHGATDDADADYSSVAFWYQTHPHAPFPPLPSDLLPLPPVVEMRIQGLIEGEDLLSHARMSGPPGATVETQDMESWTGQWSNGAQGWWHATTVGQTLEVPLSAPSAGQYEIVGYFTRAKDYGNVRFQINGAALPTEFAGYNLTVVPSGPVVLGRATLKAGENTLRMEVVGKDEKATGYLVGVDGIQLRKPAP